MAGQSEGRWTWAWRNRRWFTSIPKDATGGAVLGAMRLLYPPLLGTAKIDWMALVIQGVVFAIVSAFLLPFLETIFRWFTYPRVVAEREVARLAAVLSTTEREFDALKKATKSKPRPRILAKYLGTDSMSIKNPHNRFWVDNVGDESAFNIQFDDLEIGRSRIKIDDIPFLHKGGVGSECPSMRGLRGGRFFGVTSDARASVLETAIYWAIDKDTEIPESSFDHEKLDIERIVSDRQRLEATHEWPFTIRYTDADGNPFTSRYAIRVQVPDWRVSFVHRPT